MAKTWRCFLCDEVFTTSHAAAEHFGRLQQANPKCTISRKDIEEMEWALSRYRNEDTDLHRRIAELEGKIDEICRRAEEAGYAKGLRDGRQMASDWIKG